MINQEVYGTYNPALACVSYSPLEARDVPTDRYFILRICVKSGRGTQSSSSSGVGLQLMRVRSGTCKLFNFTLHNEGITIQRSYSVPRCNFNSKRQNCTFPNNGIGADNNSGS